MMCLLICWDRSLDEVIYLEGLGISRSGDSIMIPRDAKVAVGRPIVSSGPSGTVTVVFKAAHNDGCK